MKFLKHKSEWIVFLIIVLIFSYVRLKPMYLEAVGYTYDQGRDFLKAAELVTQRNPTFIGPTTGIAGIFHGAWWYYLLGIGFIIFHGSPIGFYYFNFIIQAAVFILFYLFSRKYFDTITALILAWIIATAPYLIFDTIFIANNVMAMATFPILLMSTLLLFDKRNKLLVGKKNIVWLLPFLTGLFLGFAAEFEFALGLLLTPIFVILLLVFNWWKKVLNSVRDYALFFIGLFIPFSLRLLFEVKNNFPQTKVLLSFITNPQYNTPKPYKDILTDRITLFIGYYNGIFMNDMTKVILTAVLLFFLALFLYRRKINAGFFFTLILGILLFIFSTFYKDTFWTYYYDGIQYLFIILMGFLLSTTLSAYKKQIAIFRICLLSVLIIMSVTKLAKEAQADYYYDGIIVQKDIVEYIQTNEKNDAYCVKIYTPPVIPYTYDYLFFYKNYIGEKPLPEKDWQDKKCWIILESGAYPEFKEKWISDNIPTTATRLSTKRIKDVDVELWQVAE